MKSKKESIYELIFCVMALISVIFAIMDMTDRLTPFLSYVDSAIWFIFVIDYIARFIYADGKIAFIRSNIFDLIAILPFSAAFRAFRMLKLLKLVKLAKITKSFRMLAVLGRFATKIKIFLNTNGLKYMLMVCIVLVLIGGTLVSVFEGMSFTDAIWWAFVTTTTVGYGDISPETSGGRIVACFLMIIGIGLIGSLTSAITNFFLHTRSDSSSSSNDKVNMVITLYNELNEEEKDQFLKNIT